MSIISKNELHLIQEKDKVFCDSRELTKQFSKEHNMILKKIDFEIREMLEIGAEGKITLSSLDYFIESDYATLDDSHYTVPNRNYKPHVLKL